MPGSFLASRGGSLLEGAEGKRLPWGDRLLLETPLTWDDGGKKGGIAFQADKNEYRGLLAGLEGITGKKAVNSDALTVKN